MFVLGHDGKIVTPLLEWRHDSSTPCSNFDGGCFRYPVSKLQKKDTDLGLKFYVILHVYNNAGHSISLTTPAFVISSTYPPGQARVLDLDPENIIDANSTRDRLMDVNSHLSQNTVCTAWSGFQHHENLILEIGVGTEKGSDDIYTYTSINGSEYHCITSDKLPVDSKLFVSVQATCTGGNTISSSDGVVIYSRDSILKRFSVMDGPACTEFKPMLQTNGTAKESDLTRPRILVGRTYMLRLVGKNPSDIATNFPVKDILVKHISIDDNHTDITFQPLIEDLFKHRHFNNSNDDIDLAELYDCEEDISAIVEDGSLRAHWQRHSQDFTYEAAAIQLVCQNSSDDACIKYLTPFISVSGHEVSFSSVHLQPGDTYFVGVRPCLNSRCINTFFSTGVYVEPKLIQLEITAASAFKEDGNCLNVTVLFDLISVANISFYQWSLATNVGNSKIISLIGQWKSLLADKSEGPTMMVSYAIYWLTKHCYILSLPTVQLESYKSDNCYTQILAA